MKLPPNIAMIGICAFVLLQLLLPLSYYWSDNPYDERFAWRMFSSVRMTRCNFELFEQDSGSARPISLKSEYHVVWINLAKRARQDVVDAMIQRACSQHNTVTGRLQCTTPEAPTLGICRNSNDRDGNAVPDGYRNALSCGDLSPSACYKRDCPSGEPARCLERLCRTQRLPLNTNLCERR